MINSAIPSCKAFGLFISFLLLIDSQVYCNPLLWLGEKEANNLENLNRFDELAKPNNMKLKELKNFISILRLGEAIRATAEGETDQAARLEAESRAAVLKAALLHAKAESAARQAELAVDDWDVMQTLLSLQPTEEEEEEKEEEQLDKKSHSEAEINRIGSRVTNDQLKRDQSKEHFYPTDYLRPLATRSKHEHKPDVRRPPLVNKQIAQEVLRLAWLSQALENERHREPLEEVPQLSLLRARQNILNQMTNADMEDRPEQYFKIMKSKDGVEAASLAAILDALEHQSALNESKTSDQLPAPELDSLMDAEALYGSSP